MGVLLVKLTLLQKLLSGQAVHSRLVVLLQDDDSYCEVAQGKVQLLHTVLVMMPQGVLEWVSFSQTVQSLHFRFVVGVHA